MHTVDTSVTATSIRTAAVTTKESASSSAVARGSRTPTGIGKEDLTTKDDSQGKSRTSGNSLMTTFSSFALKVQRNCQAWTGNIDFLKAQGQVVLVLIIAYIGNNWPYSYPRNANHNYGMFWFMNAALLVAALCTMKHIPNTRNTIQILSRSQTEEWKGWMQWAFIMVRIPQVSSISMNMGLLCVGIISYC
jgi:10 TM Acyl Transferase domain found in Cas1p